MTRIIIVRHGFSTSNLSKTLTGQYDAPLAEIGVKQGEVVSEYIFNNYNIDAIYSSDLSRAVQTIEKLSKLTNLPINLEKGLREICCGEWEGLPLTQIIKEYGENYEKWRSYSSEYCPKGGETFEDVQKRGLATIKQIASENEGKTIVIATHGGLIKSVQGKCLGLKLKELNQIPYLTNAAILEVEYSDGQLSITNGPIDHYLAGIITEMPKDI